MNKGKAILGVLAGMAAGAALGILFAPDKGARTRRNITRKGEDLADAINDKVDEKFDELMETMFRKTQGQKTTESPGAENRP